MVAKQKTLFAITAEDLMSRPVQMIPENLLLEAAAHLLSSSRITGAPVVDAEGRCVGVLSATDFLHWADTGHRPAKALDPFDSACSEWQMMEVEALPTDEVRRYMTADPVTVEPSTGVAELAQKMLDAHVHRIVVVNAECRPIGIVSVIDIVAAIARAANRNSLDECQLAWGDDRV
jgi:CBS-domain-containing membrane protein